MLTLLILEILKDGQWKTRRQIAEQLSRPRGRLNPHDISVLDTLMLDKIEVKQHKIGVAKTEYIYRLK